jgi:hypothetical protein
VKTTVGTLALLLFLLGPVPGAQAIINGALDTTHPAVGVVVDGTGTVMNGAVLIAPHWVLTSATFASVVSDGSFLLGEDWSDPVATRSIYQLIPHPAYDPEAVTFNLALIQLSAPVTDVAPIPILTAGANLQVNSSVTYVGYGDTTWSGDGNTRRRHCTNPVVSLYTREFWTDGSSSSTAPAPGDQGAPALLTVGGQPYVAGIVSYGMTSGYEVDATRVASFASWIQQTMAANVLDVPGTGSLLGPGGLAAAPNPFRPGTTISFVLAEAGPCRLAVHDLSGREVVRLADAWTTAGRHGVAWDGRSGSGATLPSGVYFATLSASGRTRSCKLVLTR